MKKEEEEEEEEEESRNQNSLKAFSELKILFEKRKVEFEKV